MKLDQWQEQILETKGNIVLRSGRQCGKSTVIAIKASKYARENPKKTIMVIAAVERQAMLLFEKILSEIPKSEIVGKPTKHEVNLKNKSRILCLPTGLSGYGIRGYTINLLIADEAAFIPDEVWAAITPMLAVTGGDKILLSTPFGKRGYFYECFEDPSYTKFHISSEECPRITREFLEQEKRRMTKLQYSQEYLGEFVDKLASFFSDDLIKSCMSLDRQSSTTHCSPVKEYYLGVDVARMGEDETVLFSVELKQDNLYQQEIEITTKTLLTETISRIKDSDTRKDYKRIYIDDGGVGAGVFDQLLADQQTGRKVIPINNSSRSLDRDGRNKRLLKEDLYSNLKVLMEQGRLKLEKDENTYLSLRSVQAEYTEDGRLKIFGSYTHIAEALVRAAWCVQDKRLKIWIA